MKYSFMFCMLAFNFMLKKRKKAIFGFGFWIFGLWPLLFLNSYLIHLEFGYINLVTYDMHYPPMNPCPCPFQKILLQREMMCKALVTLYVLCGPCGEGQRVSKQFLIPTA